MATQPTLQVLDAVGATKTINTTNPNGQALMADSQPVVLASNQSNVPVAVQGTVPVSIAATVAVSAPGNLPVAVQGTVPVSIAAAVPITASTPLDVNVKSAMAGERNPASTTNSYLTTRAESNQTIVTGSTSAVAISGTVATPVPAHLDSITVLGGAGTNGVTTGTITLGGLLDTAGTPTSLVIPIGQAPFFRVPFNWARMDSGITITLSVATDKVMVGWKPQ